MKVLDGGLEQVPGFTFSACKCGIRYPDRLDYALIASATDCNAAGVFTRNGIASAPVRLSRERISGPCRAILVNATNSNACTGKQGYENARILTAHLAGLLDCREDEVLVASTGVIGVQLPLEAMKNCHPCLIENLAAENSHEVARAIMTTDTVPKEVSAEFTTSRGIFRVAGIAKGSGMIAPNMATMLTFMITDAPLDRDTLQSIFERVAFRTLNRLTIDGDTSTSDTALILSPMESSPLVSESDLKAFEEALEEIMKRISFMLVKDGEGVTRVVTVKVTGAASEDDAEKLARTIGQSLLVKTAIFGRDPNWGRIAMAVGNAGARVSEETLSIAFGDVMVLDKGTPVNAVREKLMAVMDEPEYTVSVDIGQGSSSSFILTGDISYDYVKINAEYTT